MNDDTEGYNYKEKGWKDLGLCKFHLHLGSGYENLPFDHMFTKDNTECPKSFLNLSMNQ